MAEPQTLAARLEERFGADLTSCAVERGEVTIETLAPALRDVCRALRDEPELDFSLLMDLCGVDYIAYGDAQWSTDESSSTGFSRGVTPFDFDLDLDVDDDNAEQGPKAGRFAVVYHLLSLTHNHRLRLRVFCESARLPRIDSVCDLWASANWYEREAFDLFGIVFEGHPDLRRILSDYGFIGHPFRKDFPLSGHVEVRYDPDKKRVVYEPVSIEPRVLVPRVIRHDHRYEQAESSQEQAGNA